MRWMFGGVVAAFIGSLSLTPVLAVSCGPNTSGSVNIELQGVSAATCESYNTGNLPLTPGGRTFIDASNSGPNILQLTYTLGVFDGDVSFAPPVGYSNFAIGFQLYDGFLDFLNPDWFVFKLNGDVSEHFDSDLIFHINHHTVEFVSDPVLFAVLYGVPNAATPSTPLPAAVWLLGSVLAGGAGFGRWRKRKAKKAALVPA